MTLSRLLVAAAAVSALALPAAAQAPTQASAPVPAYAVTGSIAGPDGGWDYASFDPAMRRLYVAHGDAILAVDADSGQVTAKLAAASHSHEVLPVMDGRAVLETDGATNTARLIDARSGAVLATIPVGEKPDAAILDPTTGLAVVMNGKSGTLSLIDLTKKAVVGTVQVGGALEFGAGDGAGHVFVNIEDQGAIAVVDMKTRAVTSRIAMAGCEEPSGLAYTASRLLIAACANGVAEVVDPAAGKVVKTLTIGRGPDAVIYDARRRLAFIPCGRSGELVVIPAGDPAAIAVAATVKTALGARTGAVDEKTGQIYLPTATYNPPATPGARPSTVPGTFRILVVSPAA